MVVACVCVCGHIKCAHVRVQMGTCHGTCVDVRGKLIEVSPLFTPGGF